MQVLDLNAKKFIRHFALNTCKTFAGDFWFYTHSICLSGHKSIKWVAYNMVTLN